MDFLPQFPNNPHHSPSFVNPPVDGSLCIPEIYDFHYEHNPSHTVFLYDDPRSGVIRVPYSRVVPAIHNAGRLVAKRTQIDLESPSSPRTIAILASTGVCQKLKDTYNSF